MRSASRHLSFRGNRARTLAPTAGRLPATASRALAALAFSGCASFDFPAHRQRGVHQARHVTWPLACTSAPLVQWLERWSHEPRVTGLSPSGGNFAILACRYRVAGGRGCRGWRAAPPSLFASFSCCPEPAGALASPRGPWPRARSVPQERRRSLELATSTRGRAFPRTLASPTGSDCRKVRPTKNSQPDPRECAS